MNRSPQAGARWRTGSHYRRDFGARAGMLAAASAEACEEFPDRNNSSRGSSEGHGTRGGLTKRTQFVDMGFSDHLFV